MDDGEDSDSDLLNGIVTDSPKKDTTGSVSNGLYKMSKVSISPPNSSSVLISDLSLDVGNENVLIVGRSSAGKSSLLRVLRGLWRPSSGTVERGAEHDRSVGLAIAPDSVDSSRLDSRVDT